MPWSSGRENPTRKNTANFRYFYPFAPVSGLILVPGGRMRTSVFVIRCPCPEKSFRYGMPDRSGRRMPPVRKRCGMPCRYVGSRRTSFSLYGFLGGMAMMGASCAIGSFFCAVRSGLPDAVNRSGHGVSCRSRSVRRMGDSAGLLPASVRGRLPRTAMPVELDRTRRKPASASVRCACPDRRRIGGTVQRPQSGFFVPVSACRLPPAVRLRQIETGLSSLRKYGFGRRYRRRSAIAMR